MIREYTKEDLVEIVTNEYSGRELLDKITPLLAAYEGYTLLRDGTIKCILFFRNYAENNYEGFLVCSTYMSAFDGRAMKDFVNKTVNRLGVKRFETLSVDCPTINRWHQFLGMNCEGIKRKFLNGKDYKMWAAVF